MPANRNGIKPIQVNAELEQLWSDEWHQSWQERWRVGTDGKYYPINQSREAALKPLAVIHVLDICK